MPQDILKRTQPIKFFLKYLNKAFKIYLRRINYKRFIAYKALLKYKIIEKGLLLKREYLKVYSNVYKQ